LLEHLHLGSISCLQSRLWGLKRSKYNSWFGPEEALHWGLVTKHY